MKRNIWLSACHLPGKVNVEAERLSRKLNDDMEWKLNSNIFAMLQDRCGLFDIDLFASRLHWQVCKYVSYLRILVLLQLTHFPFLGNNVLMHMLFHLSA